MGRDFKYSSEIHQSSILFCIRILDLWGIGDRTNRVSRSIGWPSSRHNRTPRNFSGVVFIWSGMGYLRFRNRSLKYPGFPATPLTGRCHLVPGFPGSPGSIPIQAAVQRPQSPSLSLINMALHGFPPNCKISKSQTIQNAP